MAVVIRLQGLSITAYSRDIRVFFSGLKILDGGVHIIGGERAEAFIIFASDEDARRAMTRSGSIIKGSPINLMLSSMSKMQSIIEESSRIAELEEKKAQREDGSRRRLMELPLGPRRAESGMRSGHSQGEARRDRSGSSAGDVYLFLKGMPLSVTELEIRQFFHGLLVDGIVLQKNTLGQNNGVGIVKFATRVDAIAGLKRNKEYIGTRFVKVYGSNEEEWRVAGGDMAGCLHNNGNMRRGMSPALSQRSAQNRARSRSPLADRSTSPSNEDLCILLENLSYTVQKKELKDLFHPARLQDDQILYLIDGMGRRTRSAFLLFKNLRDYREALTHHKEEFLNRFVYISPISREKMISILGSCKNGSPSKSLSQERPPREQDNPLTFEKVCLYVHNMPFDVRKVEIMDFFLGFNITEDMVVFLHKKTGAKLGEALVVFQSEGEAMRAQSLNGQRFLGSEVMLKRISRSQMRKFRIVQEVRLMEKMYSARSTGASSNHDNMAGPYDPQDRGNGSGRDDFEPPMQSFDGPTRLKLVNLPSMLEMRQGERSVSDFAIEFQTLATSSGWNSRAVYDLFLRGLSETIKDEMLTRDLPEDINGLVALGIQIESRLRDGGFLSRRSTFNSIRSSALPTFRSTAPAAPRPPVEAMEVKRSRLSRDERDRRMTEGSCLYCGKPGHFVAQCPAKGPDH